MGAADVGGADGLTLGAAGKLAAFFFGAAFGARLAAARHIASGKARFSRTSFSFASFFFAFFDTSFLCCTR